jgi:hypothetical protein
MADDRVEVVFGAEFSELVAAVQQVKDQLSGLTTSVKGTSDDFALAGTTIGDAARSGLDSWQGTLNFIGTSLDTVLKGVLLGTQTWREAMAKIFADLAVSFAEQLAMMLVDWAAFQLAIGGASAAAGGGGLLGGIAGLFGGAAAGGGGAGALGDAGALAMFQAGTWSVPRDMIALVHAGEMILPAEVAAQARSGASAPPFPTAGGMPSAGANFALNVSVQAMDAQGVAQWANANAKTLATTITRYMGNNPSARGD